MTLQLVPLGTNGLCPGYDRQTMCFLVLNSQIDEALMLDAGSGVSRLYEERIKNLLRPYKTLTILLTHYHLDHVMGLLPLFEAWQGGRVRIYAPGPPLVDADHQALYTLIGPPLFGLPLQKYPYKVEVLPYHTTELDLGWTKVLFRRQQHNGGSVGMRFGDHFAYCTDTAAQKETVDFVAGVRTLLHEVWLWGNEAKQEPHELNGHTSDLQALDIAHEAKVRTLIPIHHRPFRTSIEPQIHYMSIVADHRLYEDPNSSRLSIEHPPEGTTFILG